MRTVARDRGDSFLCEVDFSQHVIFCVGNIECVAVDRHSLRMVELSRFVITICATDSSTADYVEQLAIERADDDAVMIAVGNKEP